MYSGCVGQIVLIPTSVFILQTYSRALVGISKTDLAVISHSGLIGLNRVLQAQQIYSIAVIPKLLWPLQAIQTDGLVGLIGPNRVLLALDFELTSFRKPALVSHVEVLLIVQIQKYMYIDSALEMYVEEPVRDKAFESE